MPTQTIHDIPNDFCFIEYILLREETFCTQNFERYSPKSLRQEMITDTVTFSEANSLNALMFLLAKDACGSAFLVAFSDRSLITMREMQHSCLCR